jgi:hypothetical protein
VDLVLLDPLGPPLLKKREGAAAAAAATAAGGGGGRRRSARPAEVLLRPALPRKHETVALGRGAALRSARPAAYRSIAIIRRRRSEPNAAGPFGLLCTRPFLCQFGPHLRMFFSLRAATADRQMLPERAPDNPGPRGRFCSY